MPSHPPVLKLDPASQSRQVEHCVFDVKVQAAAVNFPELGEYLMKETQMFEIQSSLEYQNESDLSEPWTDS